MSLKKIEQELHDLQNQNQALKEQLNRQGQELYNKTAELIEAKKSLQRLDRIERELHDLPPVLIGADPDELEQLRTENRKQKAEIESLKKQLQISQSNRRTEAELMQNLKELEQSFKQKLTKLENNNLILEQSNKALALKQEQTERQENAHLREQLSKRERELERFRTETQQQKFRIRELEAECQQLRSIIEVDLKQLEKNLPKYEIGLKQSLSAHCLAELKRVQQYQHQ